MIRRLVATLFVTLVALTPAMRAVCDVNCVTSADQAREATLASHCSAAPVEHRPAPAESCRHQHARAAPVVATAKVTVSPAIGVASALTPHPIAAFVCSSLAGASARPAPSLHIPFHVPLRI